MDKGLKVYLDECSPADVDQTMLDALRKEMAKAVTDLRERRKRNPAIGFFCYINPRLRAIVANYKEAEHHGSTRGDCNRTHRQDKQG